MTVNKPILELTGFATDAKTKFESILGDYAQTQHSSSNVYQNVFSLPYAVNQHQNDPDGMANKIRQDLIDMMVGYFDSYTVNATVAYDANNPGLFSIKVNIAITDNNIQFTDSYTSNAIRNGLFQYIAFNNNS